MDFQNTGVGTYFFNKQVPELIKAVKDLKPKREAVIISNGINSVDGILVQWNSDGSGLIQYEDGTIKCINASNIRLKRD